MITTRRLAQDFDSIDRRRIVDIDPPVVLNPAAAFAMGQWATAKHLAQPGWPPRRRESLYDRPLIEHRRLSKEKTVNSGSAITIGVGVGVGVGIGLATGWGVGIACGVAIGVAMRATAKRHSKGSDTARPPS